MSLAVETPFLMANTKIVVDTVLYTIRYIGETRILRRRPDFEVKSVVPRSCGSLCQFACSSGPHSWSLQPPRPSAQLVGRPACSVVGDTRTREQRWSMMTTCSVGKGKCKDGWIRTIHPSQKTSKRLFALDLKRVGWFFSHRNTKTDLRRRRVALQRSSDAPNLHCGIFERWASRKLRRPGRFASGWSS